MDEPRVYLTGMALIGEMSREELIEEIMFHQRKTAETLTIKDLRANVANFRVQEMKKRIYSEAGMIEQQSIFGTSIVPEDSDDD